MALYSKGISTKNIAEIMGMMMTIFQNRHSKSTLSAITEVTLEEVKRFQERYYFSSEGIQWKKNLSYLPRV